MLTPTEAAQRLTNRKDRLTNLKPRRRSQRPASMSAYRCMALLGVVFLEQLRANLAMFLRSPHP